MECDADLEDEIRNRLLQGDETALAQAFATHRQRLWQIVHFRMDARMAARVDPDDVLQDAFMDATKRLKHFSEEKSFTPFVWLRMIVAQTLIDAHRRHVGAQQRDASREVSSTGGAFPHSTAASIADLLSAHMTTPSQVVSKVERNDQLYRAIETMEPLDREVLALRHFEELSNKEIAEVLKIEQKTASIRYIRAIARLKKILGTIPDFNDAISSNDAVE